jgi:RNA polymerase sigma factor
MLENIDETAIKAKENDIVRNELISDYRPFIRSVAKKTFARYLEYGQDDELSVAMLAFNESIDSYIPEKGHFLPFSAWVIKRRLIDYIRKNKNNFITVPIESEYDDDDESHFSQLDHISILEYKETIEAEIRRSEIQELISMLASYDISLNDMHKQSPKHTQTRQYISEAVSCIISDKELLDQVKLRKTLPLVVLSEILDVPRKTLERSRKYIIGTVLMRTGDFEYLNSFIGWD